MATVTPKQTRNLAEDNRRVRHPLDRLRGFIRTYVGLEALVRGLLLVALWFWLTYLLDYGFYRASLLATGNGVDWVQVLPFWLRAGTLALVAGLILLVVMTQMATRLFREFSDAALALVLEKRYPQLLGDRLITAVELSDPEKAAQFGYSKAMVRETIAEAADRVDQVPVGQVFDWKRLVRRGMVLALLTLAGYLVAASAYAAIARLRDDRSVVVGVARFHDVATILFERNILLRNTIWPRQAHMEVLEPTTQELRIGRDAQAPIVRVRAYRYVIADRKAPEGWRVLTALDLVHRPELLKGEAHPPPLDWAPRDPRAGLTVDEIDLKLRRIGIRTAREDGPPLPARWNIADAKAADGYRPLLWSDLSHLPLGNLEVPRLSSIWDRRAWPVAATVGLVNTGTAVQGNLLASTTMGTGPMGLTVDEVEAALGRAQRKAGDKLAAGTDEAAAVQVVLDRLARIEEMQAMLDRLDVRVEDPGMSRTMRKLRIPATATLTYGTWTTTIRKNLQNSIEDEITGNEFTGIFTDLKAGSYEYQVFGEDYATMPRTLTVLPPPTLISLTAEQDRPAYLYYRPVPGSDGKELHGLKQPFEEIDISNFGSDVSRVEVPVGTDITLRAQANKSLKEKGVEIKAAKPGERLQELYKDLRIDGDRFEVSFKDVRQDINFSFVFYDQDGVMGSRAVQIKAKDDQAPELNEVAPDVVRKLKDGYIVSTQARIPFRGRIRDDAGLAGVRYAYTLSKLESGLRINVQALLMYAAVPALVGGRSSPALAAAYYTTAQQEGLRPAESETANQTVVRSPNLPGFEQAIRERQKLRDGRPEVLSMHKVKELLGQKQKLPFRTLLTDLTLEPDKWEKAETDPLKADFALWSLKLKAVGPRDIQPRYKMQLWVEAVDTDLDSEVDRNGVPVPHVSPSKEKFTFLVVSENELLSEIAKEEEDLRIKLEEAFNLILEAEAKLVRETLDLTSQGIKPENMGAMAGRIDTVDQVLEKQQQKTKEVSLDYERILQELRTNQVSTPMIDRVNKNIVAPLRDIADFEFGRTHDALASFKKALEEGRASNNAAGFPESLTAARTASARAREQVKDLKEALQRVLDSMQTVSGINTLIQKLRGIEEAEKVQFDLIKQIKEQLEDVLINGATKDLIPPKKR